jgi:hypothetical protein
MPFFWRASSLHNRWLPDLIDCGVNLAGPSPYRIRCSSVSHLRALMSETLAVRPASSRLSRNPLERVVRTSLPSPAASWRGGIPIA